MSRDSVIVDVDDLLELNEGDVPNIVFFVCQEAAKDIYTEDSKTL